MPPHPLFLPPHPLRLVMCHHLLSFRLLFSTLWWPHFWVCLSVVGRFLSTLAPLLCYVVGLIASTIGSAAETNRKILMCDTLLFLECQNACFDNDQTLVNNTNHRRLLFPIRVSPLVTHTRRLLFLVEPLDACSNHTVSHKMNGTPTCLDVFCSSDTNSM